MKRFELMLGAALVAYAGATSSAVAQNNDTFNDDTIIVTAQKREQNLQDVPVSIGVLTGDGLEARGIDNVQDLDSAVANLSFQKSGGPGGLTLIFIRGVGNNQATPTLRTSVIIDDVPQQSLRAMNDPLFDIEQLEVLRGPQSTLYGLNAESGLIVIKTRKPGDEFAAKATVQATSIDDFLATASVSGPVIEDVLSIGLSGSFTDQGGYLTNFNDGSDFNSEKSYAGRGRFIFTPTEALEFDLTVSGSTINADYGTDLAPVERDVYAVFNGIDLGEFQVGADIPGFTDVERYSGSLRATYKADNFDIVSVSAYNFLETEFLFDFNFAPGDLGFPPFVLDFGDVSREDEDFSQELRIVTKLDGPFNAVFGGFYNNRTQEAVRGLGGVPATPTELEFESIAVFGQADYEITDRLTATLGLRYEHAETEGLIEFTTLAFTLPPNSAAETSDDEVLGKFSLTYDVNDQLTTYASVTRGWLPGGFNPEATLTEDLTFSKETSWSYEIGAKTVLFDGRAQINVAGYLMDIDNYQEITFAPSLIPSFFDTIIADGIDARTMGFEFEMIANPIDPLTIDVGFGYNDSEYRNFVDLQFGDLSGFTLPGVPRTTTNVNVKYDINQNVYVGAGFVGNGRRIAAQDISSALGEYDGYGIFNARVGYTSEHLDAFVFVENIEDDRYFGYIQAAGVYPGGSLGQLGRPRHFGFRITGKY